ncbi:hypothetical protein OSB04_011451 [Centaurea solstitialis]|uniref:Methyltransferase n=1 Tax=Centaurea solstitialis TaxID=347529 RepID=A0AA38WCY2_9ASTR|nr:hypothetical protein OSB04_011451 [Centaurea solstitialis]
MQEEMDLLHQSYFGFGTFSSRKAQISGILDEEEVAKKEDVIETLTEWALLGCKPVNCLMLMIGKLRPFHRSYMKNLERYSRLVGILNYLIVTNEDILSPFGVLSQFIYDPYTSHRDAILRVLSLVRLYGDNKFTIDIEKNQVFHQRAKHMKLIFILLKIGLIEQTREKDETVLGLYVLFLLVKYVHFQLIGGKLLLELNRLLRPGGFFIWSATPVYNYKKIPEDFKIWEAMKKLTKSMCWEVKSVSIEKVNKIGVAVYQKPTSNECLERRLQNDPPLCNESVDPNAAWKIPLQACIDKIPIIASERGSKWPEKWPSRIEKPPYWLLSSQIGVYGKAAPEDFIVDHEHWKRVVTKSYMSGLGINWSFVRNVMDMRAVYGGFAAALKDMNVWVMNVVSIDSPDTLPIIYERGLFGIYHDWCESFSTYPRTYDLLHADHLFSKIKRKCNMMGLVAEVDRLLRPEGILIVRDKVETMNEVESVVTSMHWEVSLTYSKDKEGLLCVRKTMWRPKDIEALKYAIDQPF